VQSENGIGYSLTEQTAGHYSIDSIPMNPALKYRLHIKTSNGKEYLSDLAAAKITPPIDTVGYRVGQEDVSIYVSTHDDLKQTQYYQWQFEETWEYTSEYGSGYYYRNDSIFPRPPDQMFHTCWRSDLSTEITIASTASLSKDIVSQLPLTKVSYFSTDKLVIRYTILVKQYALTKEWYEWKQKLKKNTEELGSIFDAQPSSTGGNIHCITNPGDPVIGFIGCTTQSEKRIFIDRSQIPPVIVFTGYESCVVDTVKYSPDQLSAYFGPGFYIPIELVYNSVGALVGVQASSAYCVDCRVKGGTVTQPDFWQ
jgi:hypothetical protein